MAELPNSQNAEAVIPDESNEASKDQKRKGILERISTKLKETRDKVRDWWRGKPPVQADTAVNPIADSGSVSNKVDTGKIAQTIVAEFVPVDFKKVGVEVFNLGIANSESFNKKQDIMMNDISIALKEIIDGKGNQELKKELLNRLQQTLFAHLAVQGRDNGGFTLDEANSYMETAQNIVVAVANMDQYFAVGERYSTIRNTVLAKIRFLNPESEPVKVLEAIPLPIVSSHVEGQDAPNQSAVPEVLGANNTEPAMSGEIDQPAEAFDDTQETMEDKYRRKDKLKFLANYQEVTRLCSHEKIAQITNLGELRQLHAGVFVLMNDLQRASRGEAFQNILMPEESLRLLENSGLQEAGAELKARLEFFEKEEVIPSEGAYVPQLEVVEGSAALAIETYSSATTDSLNPDMALVPPESELDPRQPPKPRPRITRTISGVPEKINLTGKQKSQKGVVGSTVNTVIPLRFVDTKPVVVGKGLPVIDLGAQKQPKEGPPVPEEVRMVVETEPVVVEKEVGVIALEEQKLLAEKARAAEEAERVQVELELMKKKEELKMAERRNEVERKYLSVTHPKAVAESTQNSEDTKRELYGFSEDLRSLIMRLHSVSEDIGSDTLLESSSGFLGSVSDFLNNINEVDLIESLPKLIGAVNKLAGVLEEVDIGREISFRSIAELNENNAQLYSALVAFASELEPRIIPPENEELQEYVGILKSSFIKLGDIVAFHISRARTRMGY